MRYVIMVLLVVVVAVACKKEQLAPTVTLNEVIIDTSANGGGSGGGTGSGGTTGGTDTTAVLKYLGSFNSGPYGSASGKAEIYKTAANVFVLQLSNFNVSNGPALHVFVSKEAMPVNFIDLGVLKSTNGNQVYTIPGSPDFTSYKYISIHCVAFNHLFGSALLN